MGLSPVGASFLTLVGAIGFDGRCERAFGLSVRPNRINANLDCTSTRSPSHRHA
jgi:hypothetical protein